MVKSMRWKIVTYVETFGFGSSTGSGWRAGTGGGELEGGENVAWPYSSESKSMASKVV